MSVSERSMSVFDRFRPFVTFLRPEMFKNGNETFQERSDTFAKSRLQNWYFHVHASKTKESL
jgi:hypothetical protein